MEVDIFADEPEGPSEDGLSRLGNMFRKRSELDDKVEQLKAELKVAQEELRDLDERQFPELFDEVGVDSFTVGNRKVSVKEKLYGSLPKDEQERSVALGILKDYNVESVMKMVVSTSFNKGENEKATELASRIKEAGFNPQVDESIHAATYQKFLRELLEKGEVLDLKLLGVYHRRFVEVK